MATAAAQVQSKQENPNFMRAFGQLSTKAVGEDGARTALFIASTEARDRHNSIIKIAAWSKRLQRFNDNGIIAYQHHTSSSWLELTPFDPDYIIGTGRAYIEGDKLMCEVMLEKSDTNAIADKVWNKIEAGILKAMSVGFIAHDGHWGDPDEGEDSGTFYFTDVELVECSVVNIGSNYEALKRDLSGWITEHHPKQEKQFNTDDFETQLAVAKAKVEYLKLI